MPPITLTVSLLDIKIKEKLNVPISKSVSLLPYI